MTDLKPRTQSVHLMQGDDIEQVAELRAKLEAAIARLAQAESDVVAAKQAPSRVAADDQQSEAVARAGRARDAVHELTLEFDDFMAEAEKRAALVVVRALPRREYRDLLKAHPPREGDEQDESWGFNVDDFGDAMVPPAVIEPAFSSDHAKATFLESLSTAQWTTVFAAAVTVNSGALPDPKARISSAVMQGLGATSESPERLA